ncbi:aminotransferase class III-fold pyridoxal phosphate-dependent enzyme [Desulfosarcina ovata]|uniref:aminotransferase class III-fold pyridoxal phosphate-dependent enzyme n=1 Tax=Desulfosarcina ovata TaxID=83564 RepID=UPI0012D30B8F|nr:aminotransferase class III-fold pyridoxal phosphate-dependent enzyme [Desulfosarcina ovata]
MGTTKTIEIENTHMPPFFTKIPVSIERGVRIPSEGYLKNVSRLCKANGTLLIVDEIQTGFCRTGPMFAIDEANLQADFLTMAKGIAGGFPLGAFAISEEISDQLEVGDHGGTYCGNPLACAVAYAVIRYLVDNNISAHVAKLGQSALDEMSRWREDYSGVVTEVRGKGLLLIVEFSDEATAARVTDECLGDFCQRIYPPACLFIRLLRWAFPHIAPLCVKKPALNTNENPAHSGIFFSANRLIPETFRSTNPWKWHPRISGIEH